MMKVISFKLKITTKACTSKVTIKEFMVAGWMGFINKLHGFSLEVMEEFTRNYEVDKTFIK